MTDDALELRSFAEIGADMEENGQQYCPCCQHSYSWGDDEESENVPTVLTCRHTLCSACVKTQWLDVETSDDTVFCLACSKRVGIMSLKKEVEEAEDLELDIHQGQKSVKENMLGLITHPNNQMETEEKSSTTGNMVTDEGDGISSELKEGILLQEWVNTNIPENFVLRLVSSGTEHNIGGNTYILDNIGTNGLLVHTNPSEGDGLSLGDQEVDSHSVKPHIETGYPSISEGVTLQSSMIGSPDLNLKALLQMLEKNSESNLGGSADNCGIHHETELTDFHTTAIQDSTQNTSYMENLTVQDNQDINLDGVALSNKSLCDQLEMEDQWRPVDIMQRTFVQSEEKAPINQPLPCTLYLHGRNILPVNDCISTQSNHVHEIGKMNGDPMQNVWLTQVQRGIPKKSNAKPRRGRKKKPLFRHFQSEFFMRPYLKRENSPQLQLVKLVRQRAQEKKEEEEKAAENLSMNSDKLRVDAEKSSLEDPELAFMKTVDMPSGKRVEDIYVVPSVWISNEKKNNSKPFGSKEPTPSVGSNLFNYYSGQPSQRIPVQVYSHGNRSHFLNSGPHMSYSKNYQGYSHRHSSLPQQSLPVHTLKSLHSNDNQTCKPAQGMCKIIKGHIITTLNAPKIGPVPTLKDLCKTVLGFQTYASLDTANDSIYSYTNGSSQLSFPKSRGYSEEIRQAIKSPKQFLDMKSAPVHRELKMPHIGSKPIQAKDNSCEDDFLKEITHKEHNVAHTFCETSNSLPCLADDNCNSISDVYDTRMGDKYSDSEETLPENPLVSEDIKKLERSKSALNDCDLSYGGDYKVDLTSFDDMKDASSAHVNSVSNFKDGLKGVCQGSSSTTNVITSNSDYVIPIVSYKLKEPILNNFMNNPKKDLRPQETHFMKNDSNKMNSRFRNALYPQSSYPLYLDTQSTSTDETTEGEQVGLPTLVSIAKQIKCLSSFEPLNKQLSNLAASLNLLCNAEKTLYESNFVIFRQMKTENESKLGRLNMCIRKLGDSIITIGCTLQQWSKPTNNRCFKTMGVLTDLYNSNIVGLIELITPYFHYICELIASCHSDIMMWNKDASNDHSSCLEDSAPIDSSVWQDLNVENTGTGTSCSKPVSTFTYSETSKSSSPKDFSRQEYDRSLSSEEFMESEASNSGHTSAKTSPKLKSLANTKRGRPLGSKNGQRKSKGIQLKNKLKRRSPLMSGNQNFHNSSGICQPSMILPNTILVSMSSENFWNEASATILDQPQSSTHLSSNHDNENADLKQEMSSMQEAPASWVLPSGMVDNCQSLPMHLNISPVQTADTTLSLLDQEYTSNLDAVPDLIDTSIPKGMNDDCSPNKKLKYQDNTIVSDDCSNIVFTLPKGINIVLRDSSTDNTEEDMNIAASDPSNQDEAIGHVEELHNFQNSIYYIKGADNSDDELQLDHQIFSGTLIRSLKENTEMQEKYQISFMQDCSNAELEDNVKDLMDSSSFDTSINGDKIKNEISESYSRNVNDSIGDLCQNDEFDMNMNYDENNVSILHTRSFDEHL